MNLRLRFAIMFTIIVAIILLASSAAIYYFYSSNRKTEYQNKLKTEGLLVAETFLDSGSSTINLQELGDKFLLEKKVVIFSEDRKNLLTRPDSASIKVSTKTFLSIKQQKEHYYKVGNREFIGIYFEKENIYVISSAIDKDGLRKLLKLRIILLGVFLTSVLITISVSYFFVTSALKPLSKLAHQIQQTTEKNLNQQVDEGNGKDEIAQIASNYNAMLMRLKKAFELQKNFIHHASHELRTPLTVMHATTEAALNKQHSEAEYKKILASLKEDQNNLIELTNSLLLLSQFEKLQFSQNWQSYRIDELIYDAVDYCKKIFPGIVIDFSFENVPEEVDLFLKANDTLLKAAFTNLIKNAFLYSTDKHLMIALIATKQELKINFDNKGEHLSDVEIQNMKIPFSNGENIGIVKGIGLGLSIVEKIITLHKGYFTYSPMPNDVNRFSIKLK